MDGTPIELKSEDSVEYPPSLVEWMRENREPCDNTKPELVLAMKDGTEIPVALYEKIEALAVAEKVAEKIEETP